MAVDKLICIEDDGSLSFGNHTLAEKAKLEDFPYEGNLMKVKTFKTMTKLEKNGSFMYESVPGTSVYGFKETAEGISFTVEGTADEDAQITLGLEEDKEYEIIISGSSAGKVKTNMGGKLNFSVDLSSGAAKVEIRK